MLGYEVIAEAISAAGVRTIFGVLGNLNLMMADTAVREHGIQYVPATHEASAVMMARGFALSSGLLGVATTTCGPGFTNALTSLAACSQDRIPVVVITGEAPMSDEPYTLKVQQTQTIGVRELTMDVGALYHPIRSSATIGKDVSRAIQHAVSARQPVVVSVPYAIMHSEAPSLTWFDPQVNDGLIVPSPESLDRAVGALMTARRPLVVAGRGAVNRETPQRIVQIARQVGAPLATSALAAGLFRDEPCNIGIFGTVAHQIAIETIAEADCIISFGASMNAHATDGDLLLRGKTVIHCDLDPAKHLRLRPGDIGVLGDCGAATEAILEMLLAADADSTGFASSELASRLAERTVAKRLEVRQNGTVDPSDLTDWLGEVLPPDRWNVFDAGRYLKHALNLSTTSVGRVIATHTFGNIGSGVSTAIGTAIASPGVPVVAICGDGGFMMGGLAEFHTAVREGLDLIVVLYNDSAYGAEHVHLVNRGLDGDIASFAWPDFAAVALAMGAQAIRINSPNSVADAVVTIANRDRSRPLLIDAKLDPIEISASS